MYVYETRSHCITQIGLELMVPLSTGITHYANSFYPFKCAQGEMMRETGKLYIFGIHKVKSPSQISQLSLPPN